MLPKWRHALPLLLLAGPVHAADWEPGEVINDAAAFDLTEAGFAAMANILPALVPADPIALESVSQAGGSSSWCLNYEFTTSNMWVAMEVVGASITPGAGVLDVEMEVEVRINESADPFEMYTELFCAGDTCYGRVEPFTATVSTTIAMEVVNPSTPDAYLDATVAAPTIDYDLSSDNIVLEDCTIGTVETILNYLGLSMYDLILGVAAGSIEDALSDSVGDIELLIEEAFAGVVINQELALGESTVDLSLYPADVNLDNDGMRVAMSGSIGARDPAECISVYDPGSSRKTASGFPDITDMPPGISAGDLTILMSDDITNQGLYAAWQGGLLCYTIDASSGFPINTSILDLFAGDAYSEVFPEPGEMLIQTYPRVPLEMELDGPHDINVGLEGLGLGFMAEIDGRLAKALEIELNGVVGVDMNFNQNTGELALDIALSSENIDGTVSANEIVPEASDDIEANFGATLGTLLETFLGDQLSGFSFALPGLDGIGLTSFDVSVAGDGEDWLGIYSGIGEVTYESAGCDESGGCATDGADCGGCAVGRGMGRWQPGLLALALLGWRRRRDA